MFWVLDYFLINQYKHVIWVLKRTVPLRRFFWVPQHMFWLRNKKNNFQVHTLIWGPAYYEFGPTVQGCCFLMNFKPIWDFMAVLVTCKNEEEPIKMKEIECSQDFPHYNPMGVAMETRVLIRSGPKPYATFPPPLWWSRQNLVSISLLVSEIFMFECVNVWQMYRPTDAGLYPIL